MSLGPHTLHSPKQSGTHTHTLMGSLQAFSRQSSSSRCLLEWRMLQSHHHLCSPKPCSSTPMTHTGETKTVLCTPDTAFLVLCRTEGSPSWPANHAAMPFSAKSMSLFTIKMMLDWLTGTNQHSQVFLCPAIFKPQSLACADAWSYFCQVQDMAFSWVDLHKLPVRPFLQPVWVSLNLSDLSAILSSSSSANLLTMTPTPCH